MGQEHNNDNNVVRDSDRLTISEAATLLGVHPNTVRNRIKDGTYLAEKIVTEHGPTWMLHHNSLVTNSPTSGSQSATPQIVNKEALDLVQELLRPFVEDLGRVREELGAERMRREQAERERDELAARLTELERTPEPRESDESDVGTSELRPGVDSQGDDAGPEAGVSRRSWWRRIFSG